MIDRIPNRNLRGSCRESSKKVAEMPVGRLANQAANVNIVHFRTVGAIGGYEASHSMRSGPGRSVRQPNLDIRLAALNLTPFSHSGRLQASVWRVPSNPCLPLSPHLSATQFDMVAAFQTSRLRAGVKHLCQHGVLIARRFNAHRGCDTPPAMQGQEITVWETVNHTFVQTARF